MLFESKYIFRFTIKCILFFENVQIRTKMYFTFYRYIVFCYEVLLIAFNVRDNYFCNIQL